MSYLPALKDKDNNIIIGLMGQFDNLSDALDKKLADGFFYIPFGLNPAVEIVEYDESKGLPNFIINITANGINFGEAALIAGPKFDEMMENI